MKKQGIPRDVEEFILRSIHSVEQLEILLLLAKDIDRDWTVEEILSVIKTAPSSVESRLTDLCGRRLVSKRLVNVRTVYRCSMTPSVTSCVHELSKFYESHKDAVITLIYSRPAEAIRIFAEALQIRRDDD